MGVDRLEYIKGSPQRLKAFDLFLTENPDWIGKVVLVQLAIPTRSDVKTYQRLREEVECLIGHIKGKRGAFRPIAPGQRSKTYLSQEHSHILQSATSTDQSHPRLCVLCTPSPTSATSPLFKTA